MPLLTKNFGNLTGAVADNAALVAALALKATIDNAVMTGNFDIQSSQPAYKDRLASDAAGNLVFSTTLAKPGGAPPSAALAGAGAGNVDNGSHRYEVTYVTAGGETNPSGFGFVTVTDKTANGQVSLTSIPVSPSPLVTARKIYRTTAGSTTNYLLLTTIANNTSTTFTDNVADASLGAAIPSSSTNTAIDVKVTFLNDGSVKMSSLPTADPHAGGVLWNNAGVVTVSAG